MSDHVFWVTCLSCTILNQLEEKLHQTTKPGLYQLGLAESASRHMISWETTDQISYTSFPGSASTLLVPLPHPLQVRRDTFKRSDELAESHDIRSS